VDKLLGDSNIRISRDDEIRDILLRKEAGNRHFGRHSDAKTPFIRSRSSKVIDFGINGKRVYTFLLAINSNFSSILHRFGGMAA